MMITKLKLTPAQQLLLSALFSILGSAVITGITAAYQYYNTQQGPINVGVLLNVFLVTFLAFFGKSLLDYVPAHAALELQVWKDTAMQLQTQLATSQDQGPLVVIHTATVPAPIVNTSPVIMSATPTLSPAAGNPVQVPLQGAGTDNKDDTTPRAVAAIKVTS